jgi:hypothetical protein
MSLSRFFLYLSRLFADKHGHERDGTYHEWENEE